jgi:hypothetical protein
MHTFSSQNRMSQAMAAVSVLNSSRAASSNGIHETIHKTAYHRRFEVDALGAWNERR